MKIIDNILFIEFAEMVECGVSEGYLWKARSTGVKSIKFIDDPDDRRKVLIEYEALSDKYKQKIQSRYGNPYEVVARMPIKALVSTDIQAERFYLSFRFENGASLPGNYVTKYTTAASWLNMLVKVNDDKSFIKKNLNISLSDFYSNLEEIIRADKIDLPSSYRKLRPRIQQYKTEGYACLIEKWRFNNNHAAKVSDDVSKSLLLELIADNSQHDDVVISRIYNKWALANNYPAISDATVGNHRRSNEWQLQPFRDGNKVWYNNYGKHLLRSRPSAPLLLVGGDGNDWDMFFQTEKKGQVYYFDKHVLVVVMDAFNDYILGWSIGKTENIELIQAAWFDALKHIRELTGSYLLPHQLQTDHFGHATLNPFYSKLVENYHPAKARAPRGKYIERAFGITWHQVLRQYKNYSGPNITAKSKVNTDRIEQEKKNFPHTSEAFMYAHDFIEQLRLMKTEEGISRQQQWLEGINELSRSRMITDEQFLFHFGILNPNQQTITNRGLQLQINNQPLLFDIPDEYYLQSVGKKIQVIYDPYDFSRVLVTDGNKLRFIAKEPELLPAARADFKEGDEERFWKRLHQKKRHMQIISEARTKRQEVLYENDIDAEGLLQAGVLIKEIKQQAESRYTAEKYLPNQNSNQNTSGEFDPLELM